MLARYYLEYVLRKLTAAPDGTLKVAVTMYKPGVTNFYYTVPCDIVIQSEKGFALVKCRYEDTSTEEWTADTVLVTGGYGVETYDGEEYMLWPAYTIAGSSSVDIAKGPTSFPLAFFIVIESKQFSEAITGVYA